MWAGTHRALRLAVAACLAAAATACPAPPDPDPYDCVAGCRENLPDRCFTLQGACVIVLPPVSADLACLDRAIGRALAYWSAPPGVLAGWCIVFTPNDLQCNGDPAAGCSDWGVKVIEVKALDPACPETAQLVHELGHVLYGDAGHEGTYWCWETEQKEIRRIVRAPDASPACTASPWYTYAANLSLGCNGTGLPP